MRTFGYLALGILIGIITYYLVKMLAPAGLRSALGIVSGSTTTVTTPSGTTISRTTVNNDNTQKLFPKCCIEHDDLGNCTKYVWAGPDGNCDNAVITNPSPIVQQVAQALLPSKSPMATLSNLSAGGTMPAIGYGNSR